MYYLLRYILLLLISAPAIVSAVDLDNKSSTSKYNYSLLLSPYTIHWKKTPEHSSVWLIGLQRENFNHQLSGISYFKNSFNQKSMFVYPWGKIYDLPMSDLSLLVTWRLGLIYGYKGKYKNKVPLNMKGFSPGFTLSFGWRSPHNIAVEFNLLAAAGMMLSFTLPLDN